MLNVAGHQSLQTLHLFGIKAVLVALETVSLNAPIHVVVLVVMSCSAGAQDQTVHTSMLLQGRCYCNLQSVCHSACVLLCHA